MQMTKIQKTMHVLFRVLIFLAFGTGICQLFLFMTIAVAADSSMYSYSSVLSLAQIMCNMYYAEFLLSVLAVIFSIVCFRAVSLAATVVRTIFLIMAAGFNLVSYPAYETIRKFSAAYISSDYYSMLKEYRTYASTDFEYVMAIALIMLIAVLCIYFILSVTSIVALAKKPAQQTNAAYQQYYQQLYGNNQYGNAQFNNYGYGQQNPNFGNSRFSGQYNPQYNTQQGMTGFGGYSQNADGYSRDIFDENGVKQGMDGRKILRYDTMTGEPVYEEMQMNNQTENRSCNQEQRQEEAVNNENQNTTLL